MIEGGMVGWHHRLNGHEFVQTLGVGDGQGGLSCCSPWGHKESAVTELLNQTEETEGLTCWLRENPLAMQEMQETQVRFLVWEDPLEIGMATCSSILA